jgi:hypothetical protein
MYACNFWINCFPSADSASATLSLREIVTGMRVTYDKHCQLQFGDYVQTHQSHNNTMLPRTTGAIALRPTGNEQGGHFFHSLTSGRMLNRNKWTVLPMPSDVVDRIHVLSRRSRATRDGLDIEDDIDGETENASHAPSQLATIQTKAMAIITAKCGFNRHTKMEVLYGPRDLGGAEFCHLITQQGICQTTYFLRHWRSQSSVGKLLKSAVAWTQLSVGTSYSILE